MAKKKNYNFTRNRKHQPPTQRDHFDHDMYTMYECTDFFYITMYIIDKMLPVLIIHLSNMGKYIIGYSETVFPCISLWSIPSKFVFMETSIQANSWNTTIRKPSRILISYSLRHLHKTAKLFFVAKAVKNAQTYSGAPTELWHTVTASSGSPAKKVPS